MLGGGSGAGAAARSGSSATTAVARATIQRAMQPTFPAPTRIGKSGGPALGKSLPSVPCAWCCMAGRIPFRALCSLHRCRARLGPDDAGKPVSATNPARPAPTAGVASSRLTGLPPVARVQAGNGKTCAHPFSHSRNRGLTRRCSEPGHPVTVAIRASPGPGTGHGSLGNFTHYEHPGIHHRPESRTQIEAELLISLLRQAGLHPLELGTSSHYSLAGVDIDYSVRVPTRNWHRPKRSSGHMTPTSPEHALQRTRPTRRCCHPRPPTGRGAEHGSSGNRGGLKNRVANIWCVTPPKKG